MSVAEARYSAPSAGTLFDAVLPVNAQQRTVWLSRAAAVVAGSLLLTIAAKISIPFLPVNMTMQTLVVLCLGMVLGPRLGAGAVIFYLMQGAMGLPVFTGTPERGVGIAYMLQHSGGYLVGFVAAAFVVGMLAQRRWDRSVPTTIAAMLIGNAIIYVFGLLWLGTLIGWDKPVFAIGMTPYLLGDLAKLLIATALLPALWKLTRR